MTRTSCIARRSSPATASRSSPGDGPSKRLVPPILASPMKVLLRNPKRELDVPAPKNVGQLLRDLDVVAESVLVIRNDTLATHDERLSEDDVIEIRPVVSGGGG